MTEPEYRYLLGKMDEQEREAFAVRLLEDASFMERVEEAETELYDAYAQGRLAPADREIFAERFLGDAEGQARLAFSRALVRKTRRGASWWIAGTVAAGILLAAVVGGVLRRGEPPASPEPEPVTLASVRLSPVERGADAPQTVVLPSGDPSAVVAWSAGLPADLYGVELETARGQRLWTSPPIRATGGLVEWRTPLSVLGTGAFVFTVRRGGDPVAYFDIVVRFETP